MAGFSKEALTELQEKVVRYAKGTKAETLVRILLAARQVFFGMGQTATLFLPRLRRLDGETQPATFIFSGTAAISPELTDNPHVTLLSGQLEESYERLKIYVQRGDAFRGSKTAFAKAHALEAAIRWIEHLLPQVAASHHKVLLVTYQIFASDVWNRLSKFHNLLIPYIDSNGNPQAHTSLFRRTQWLKPVSGSHLCCLSWVKSL